MSQDLLATVHQVLSSDDLEIQELVQRISSARYLDEETKDQMIEILEKRSLGQKIKQKLGFGGKNVQKSVGYDDKKGGDAIGRGGKKIKVRPHTGKFGQRTKADYDKDKAALDQKRASASAERKRKKDAEDREIAKRKREREAKKRFDASPAGKEKKKKDDAERAAHFARQDDPKARHAGGMYQDH